MSCEENRVLIGARQLLGCIQHQYRCDKDLLALYSYQVEQLIHDLENEESRKDLVGAFDKLREAVGDHYDMAAAEEFRYGKRDRVIDAVVASVEEELRQALEEHPPMPTAHDGWAVIWEEVDELWQEVKKKPKTRSIQRMKKEAIQVAAMGIRFVLDVCGGCDEGEDDVDNGSEA